MGSKGITIPNVKMTSARRKGASGEEGEEGEEGIDLEDHEDEDEANDAQDRTGLSSGSEDDRPDSDQEEGAKFDRKAKAGTEGDSEADSDADKSADKDDALETSDNEAVDVPEATPVRKRSTRAPKDAKDETKQTTVKTVQVLHQYIQSLDIDKGTGVCSVVVQVPASALRVQMLELVESVAKSCVVRCVPGVKRAICETAKGSGQVMLQTEGVNLQVVSETMAEQVDLNKIRTNDIHAIMLMYGIEAARSSIMHEISSVFAVYGIAVDNRHLSLIADSMTYTGTFVGSNRSNMRNSLSPFLKMSFESCVTFLTEAASRGEVDTLTSPAALIVMGQVPHFGTGGFQLVHPLSVKNK